MKHTSLARFWKDYIYRDTAVCDKIPFHGVVMNKLPCDMFIYQDLFYRYHPDTLVEIGTGGGGSSRFFHEVSSTRVITVDIAPVDDMGVGITYITGDATNIDVFKQISAQVTGDVWIIDDGSHRVDDILKCFELYSDFVPLGGFYIVEDGISAMLFKDRHLQRPCIAIDTILNNGSGFVLFDEYDQFVFSSIYRGILRKNRLSGVQNVL